MLIAVTGIVAFLIAVVVFLLFSILSEGVGLLLGIVTFIALFIFGVTNFGDKSEDVVEVVKKLPTVQEINRETSSNPILYKRGSVLHKPKVFKHDPETFVIEFDGVKCYFFKSAMSCLNDE